MKSTYNKSNIPAEPGARKRQSDHSLFANTESGILPTFEDPADLALVRSVAAAVIEPANEFERLVAEQAVRSLCRSHRLGGLESAAVEVQMADHQDAARSQWSNLHPESLYHISTREPATRAAIHEFSARESAAMRRFRTTVQCLRAVQKAG